MTNSIVAEFLKFKGDKYVYGGTGPTSFDCSGLVQYSLQQLGYKNVPRTSEAQYKWADKIPASQLAPGDLVFAQFPGDNASPGHVGVYLGGGQVLSAEDPALGVGQSSLASWSGHIVGYGRVPGSPESTPDGGSGAIGGASLTSLVSDAGSFLSDLNTITTLVSDIAKPSFWVRVGAFAMGAFLLAFGIWALVKQDGNLLPETVPVPV